MAFVYDRLIDTVDLNATSFYSAAYSGRIGGSSGTISADYYQGISPSGRYLFCWGTVGSRDTQAVVDLTVPELKYKRVWDSSLGDSPVIWGDGLEGFKIKAVDDEGTAWGTEFGYGYSPYLGAVDLDETNPTVKFNWENLYGQVEGGSVNYLFTFTMPDASIKILIFPGAATQHDNPYFYLGTKGVVGLSTFNTTSTSASWAPDWAFQDDNGDIWVVGGPKIEGGALDTMYLWRITEESLAYDDFQTFTMPSIDTTGGNPEIINLAHAIGFFKAGYFVGGWFGSDSGYSNYSTWLFRANMTTQAVTTREIESSRLSPYLPPSPDRWFIMPSADANETEQYRTRQFREITIATLADAGTEYNLNQWEATGDIDVWTSWFVDPLTAFVGQQAFYTDDPVNENQHGDLYIYYFAGDEAASPDDGEGDGLNDESVRLRVWGFSLDGHDYYVLRIGPSESLIYDLTTNTWSSWQSPGRTNWRAHVGQNWLGMSIDSFDAGNVVTEVVAGDDASNVLWTLDPTSGRDDRYNTGSDYFQRTVTGGLRVSGRDTVPAGALTLDLAVGVPTQTGASITLEVSDNLGYFWINCGTVVIPALNYSTVVEWRGLGTVKAPGRIFRITDNGASVRINAANLR